MAQSSRPENRSVPTPGVTVELRVHGVGGATPEEMLGVPVTELVAGDESAGFFREWRATGSPVVEGYSWGGLTSASRMRALWVFLSPFALANLAGWMLRHGGDAVDRHPRPRSRAETVGAGLVRVFGVIVTITVASYVAVGAMDLVAYQCGAHPTCVGGRWWLSPWANRWVAGSPGRAVAVGAVIAAALLLGLAWLARRSQLAIHPKALYTGRDDPAFVFNLHQPQLWQSPHVAHRLGLVHTAAALGTIANILAGAGEAGGVVPPALVVAGWSVLGLCVALTSRLQGLGGWVCALVVVASSVHLAVTAAVLWWGQELVTGPGRLAGADLVDGVLLPVYPVMIFMAGAVALILRRRHQTGSLMPVLVAPSLLAGAAGMVSAFGSGVLVRLADLLGTPVPVSGLPVEGSVTQPLIVYSDAVADTAVMTVLAAVVFVAVVALTWFRSGRGTTCDELAVEYADRGGLDCSDPEDQSWARRVGRARVVATLTNRVGEVVVLMVVLVVGALAVAGVGGDATGLGLGPWAEPLAGPASVAVGLMPLGAVLAVSRLYRSRALRRTAGVLWDVATFWPRWFHPWSPPSYGERAVPQLGHRLQSLTEAGAVVLSAHSQGSILAVATLVPSPPTVTSRTALLTHGCPLSRLYTVYFPEYFSAEMSSDLAARLAGWVNLWRPTDYIGDRIGVAGVTDQIVVDPPSTRPATPGDLRPVPERHSGYEDTDEYRRALASLLDRLG